MTSAAQRRRNRKKLPKLAPIEKIEQAREKGRFVRQEEDPRKIAVEARERALGILPTGKDGVGLLDPLLGAPMGCVIQSLAPKHERSKIWSVWQTYSQAERSYRIRYLGIPDPQGASIQMVPEKVEADPNKKPDLRSEEEKDQQVISRWMRWQDHLGRLSPERAVALRMADRDCGPELWRHGAPTEHGKWAYESLLLLKYFSERD